MNLVKLFLLTVPLLLAGCHSYRYETGAHSAWNNRSGFVFICSDVDADRDVIYGNAELAERRAPPCSTFKIVSTLMGLSSGILTDRNTRLGYDGTKYEYDAWNRDLTLREAFQVSCVPYYKKLTGKLKREYVRSVLDGLDYGNCDLSVWNSNGHNVFWIESSLLISPREQIAVLKKIFSGRSRFSPEHVALLRECMAAGNAGGAMLYGKTGTGRNHNTNRLEAWFVGFAEAPDGKKLFFAAHGADPKCDVSSADIREAVRNYFKEKYGALPNGQKKGTKS